MVALIGFGGGCWAIGDLILRYLLGKEVHLHAVARYSLAFATGNVFLSYFITALGFSGFFTSEALWTMFIVCLGLFLWKGGGEVNGLLTKSKEGLKGHLFSNSEIPNRDRENHLAAFFLIALTALFYIPVVMQAAAPPYLRDSLVYHLLCPKAYLKAGSLIHIPGNLFSAFPKGHEVLMTLLLEVAGDRAAQGFSIFQQISAIGGFYGLNRLLVGPRSAVLCVTGFATVPPVIYFSGCGYVEPALLMNLGGSLLILFLYIRSVREKSMSGSMTLRFFSLIGFLAGWMSSLKYSGLIYLGLVGLILLWSQRKVPLKKALGAIGTFSLSATPGFCWMGWNWITLGNPVYPMGWFLFGGRGWDESRALAMSLYFNTYGMGKNLSDYLLLMWRLAFSGRFDSIRFDGAIGPFLLLFLALAAWSAYLLIRRRINGGVTKQIGFMFIVSTAFFVFGTQQTRFWLPSQMLVCVFAAPSVEFLLKWASRKQIAKIVIFLILIGSLAWNVWFLGKQFIAVGYYKPVLGIEQEKDFLVRKVPGYPALEFINQNLPQSSQLMCVWTGAYGYYIDRKYYSDTFIEDITLKGFIHASANGRELSRRLTKAGFTHLFLNLALLEKNMEQSERIILGDFLMKETRELFRYQNYGVFEIRF